MGIRSSALAKRLMGEPHIGLFNTSNNVFSRRLGMPDDML